MLVPNPSLHSFLFFLPVPSLRSYKYGVLGEEPNLLVLTTGDATSSPDSFFQMRKWSPFLHDSAGGHACPVRAGLQPLQAPWLCLCARHELPDCRWWPHGSICYVSQAKHTCGPCSARGLSFCSLWGCKNKALGSDRLASTLGSVI